MTAAARRLFAIALVLGLLAAVGGASQSGSAALLPSFYTFAQTGGTTVDTGTSATLSFQLTNCLNCGDKTSLQSLNSATVTPGGFTVASPRVTGQPLAKTWNISVENKKVKLAAADVASALLPGESVTFEVTATAPCTPGDYIWSSDAFGPDPLTDEFDEPVGGDPATSATSALDRFDIKLPDSPVPFAAQVGSAFTVTVTAREKLSDGEACGETAQGYDGTATLSGDLIGVNKPYATLQFSDGVAVPANVTPVESQSQASLTVTDSSSGITSTSSKFDVFDLLVTNCTNGCSNTITDTKTTTVNVSVPNGNIGPNAFLGLSLDVVQRDCFTTDGTSAISKEQLGDGTVPLHTIVPPTRTGTTDPVDITVTVEYDKTVVPGTGVANFVYCMTAMGQPTATGQLRELPVCPTKKNPDVNCILKRHRDNAGDLIFTVLINSKDPVGGGYG